jgi:outer membrane immunogenic protein
MSNKFLLAAASAVALTGPAFAAEPLPPPPPPPPVFSWTGVYTGLQVGGVWGAHNNGSLTGLDPLTGTPFFVNAGGTPSGVIGGAHLGAQYQYNQWIIGMEGSADGSSIKKNLNAALPLGFASADISSPVQGSIRGKIGIAWDRFMIYGTGGLSVAEFHNDWSLSSVGGASVVFPGLVVPPFFVSSNVHTVRAGWTAGGGAQYAFTPNWWVFVEYRFSDFGTLRSAAFPGLPSNVFFNGERRVQTNQVQAGISYKFDLYPPPPPIVSKY